MAIKNSKSFCYTTVLLVLEPRDAVLTNEKNPLYFWGIILRMVHYKVMELAKERNDHLSGMRDQNMLKNGSRWRASYQNLHTGDVILSIFEY